MTNSLLRNDRRAAAPEKETCPVSGLMGWLVGASKTGEE